MKTSSVFETLDMRYTGKILILLFICGLNNINAQTTDSINVYYQALKLHLDYRNNFNKERPDLVQIPSVYYIEQNDFTTDSLPLIINGHRIQILTSQELFDKTKNQKIYLIAIRPARWHNNRLEIHVIDFGVSRKRKHYYFTNGGGSSFEIICNGDKQIGLKILDQGGL